MYSDISRRIIAFSSPNIASASALHSSVLPTPVGPRKINEPIGRFLSFRPTRPRRIALAIAVTASSCPMTRWCSVSSSFRSRSLSSCVSCTTGMPVHIATISAISSALTTLLLRSLCAAHSFFFCSSSSDSDFCLSRSSAARSKSCSLTAAALSSSTSLMRFSSSCRSSGAVKVLSLTREAASSTRSIALSGR